MSDAFGNETFHDSIIGVSIKLIEAESESEESFVKRLLFYITTLSLEIATEILLQSLRSI